MSLRRVDDVSGAGAESTVPATSRARGVRGRPRMPGGNERILEAAIDELAERGAGDLTFERVASRAGVSRNTVYRRWPTKVELLVGALELLQARAVVPDTGDLRADLEAGLANLLRIFGSDQGHAVGTVLSAGSTNEELRSALASRVYTPQRDGYRRVLQRALDKGQVELTLGMDETIAVLNGIAFVVMFGAPVADRPGLAAGVVSTVLDGICRSSPTGESSQPD